MAIASLYPTIKPSLLLDFANSKKLDPRVKQLSDENAKKRNENKELRKQNEELAAEMRKFGNLPRERNRR